MRAFATGGPDQPTKITMELTLAEAQALNKELGKCSLNDSRKKGLTDDEAEIVYNIYDKLDDAVMVAQVMA